MLSGIEPKMLTKAVCKLNIEEIVFGKTKNIQKVF